MSAINMHDEWLSLIEVSGPFLAVPVLKEVFPQGLEELDGLKRKRLRQTYEEWREALDTDDMQFQDIHVAWINEVLSNGLEFDEGGTGGTLKRGNQVATSLRVTLPEHNVTLTPDFTVVDSSQDDKPLMLIHMYAANIDLEAAIKQDGWAASPAERMVQLCRMTGCRIGLVTNGERWMLVDAPVGAVTSFASWYARIWSQEPITLQAFVHLLGIRRFFFDESEQLPALFDRSLKYQDEVTEALGEQVRRAVEVLIQSLDKADQDRNRELLREVAPTELYEAGLTVMMRLVFLLSAEERGLLLMGDERYEANYALSTLRMQLRSESEEILERRWDAWSRLLAIFRAVFGGIEHENLRMPALGGSLFDPDRFPFLEGRAKGSQWLTDAAKPLPIDNRTVLLLLEAIQQYQGRTLSYRALDVEQIGYVYEGLLERTVKRTDEVTLELDSTKNAKTPWLKLGELESAKLDGVEKLAELLIARTGSSANRIRNDLARPIDDTLADRLLATCQGNQELRNRIKPYAHLLRTDPWGYPLVYLKGAFIVTTGSDRRETGAHYTPKSLTEAIVVETLTPVVYLGPAEGKPKVDWILKSSFELLNLKICDPAMGSGAFLVQACRWLSDRLVEAWDQAEVVGQFVDIDGEVLTSLGVNEPLPRGTEVRSVIARRLIAERCLYGVDLNPLAVELAKLSIWLVTLAKNCPFGFLDHNLRFGNSLLGTHRLDQLTELSMTPSKSNTQMRVFGRNIKQTVREAIELRQRLREMPIRDIHDVAAMARLDNEVRNLLEISELIADAFIGEVFSMAENTVALEIAVASLAVQAEHAISGDQDALKNIMVRTSKALSVDMPQGQSKRRPFHWALEFPEVFERENGGFDAIIGNPPFLGGKRISTVLGTTFNAYLAEAHDGANKNSDLVAHFFRRAFDILRPYGCFGLLATNTIAEGDTRQGGLEWLLRHGATIYAAWPNEPWPGAAAVVTSRVHIHKGNWQGSRSLLGRDVLQISAFLSEGEEWSPKQLRASQGLSFQGSIALGMGFVISNANAKRMIDGDPRNADVIFPYLNGDALSSDPRQMASRWVINFWDWPEDKAKTYSLPYQWICDHVYQERLEKSKEKSYKNIMSMWWLHWNARPGLYHAIGRGHQFCRHPVGSNVNLKPLEYVLAVTRVSKYLNAVLIHNKSVFTLDLFVFAMNSFAAFALLQSNIFGVWAWAKGGRMKSDLRFSGTDAFETFPLLDFNQESIIGQLGERFHSVRASLMEETNSGLTKVTNMIHNPNIDHVKVCELRELWRSIDLNVSKLYGWYDLNLSHGFHDVAYRPEADRLRYTVSETARLEIIRRLAELNRQRYAEEVGNGKYIKTINRTPRSNSSQYQTIENVEPVQGGFDFDANPTLEKAVVKVAESGNQWGSIAIDQILAWLEAHGGWFAKDVILKGCGASTESWDASLSELLDDDFIESRGDGDEVRYRAKP